MAKKKPKKPAKKPDLINSKTGLPRTLDRKFNPLDQPYKTWADLEVAAKQEAQSELQPGIDKAKRNVGRAESASQGRQRDIQRYGGWLTEDLKGAFEGARNTVNQLGALSAGSSETARNTLHAALQGLGANEQDMATLIGGGSGAPNLVPLQQQAVVDNASLQANQNNFLGSLGESAIRAGRDVGLGALRSGEASAAESRRFRAQDRELNDALTDIMDRVGPMTTVARNRLLENARKGQNQRFTQNLANKEFGLKKDNTEFTQDLARDEFGLKKKQFKHQQWVDRQNAAVNWQTVQNQADTLQAQIEAAGSGEERARLEKRGQQFNRAGEMLDKYMAPANDREKKKPELIIASRDPWDIYNSMRKRAGVSRKVAIRLIRSVPQWKKFPNIKGQPRSTAGRSSGRGR